MWFNLRFAVVLYCLPCLFSVDFKDKVDINSRKKPNQIALSELEAERAWHWELFVVNPLPFASAVCSVLDELDT